MLYSIVLDDYATPSYISFLKQYYGTEEEILSVMKAIKDLRPDLYEAATDYFAGTGDGIVSVGYGPLEQFIKPVMVLVVLGSRVFTNAKKCRKHLYCYFALKYAIINLSTSKVRKKHSFRV